jgi:hypothetical protein
MAIVTAQALPGQGGTNIPSCKRFRVTMPSTGATFRINGQGQHAITSGEVYVFHPNHDNVFPDVFIVSGPNVPIQVIASVHDGILGIEEIGSAGIPLAQVGDLPAGPVTGTTTAFGTLGIPILTALANGAGAFRVLPYMQTGGNVLIVNSNGSVSAASQQDLSFAAGLGGTIGLVTSSVFYSCYVEVSFSAPLTGARTVDVNLRRTDLTTMSLFDPVRNPAPVLAVGRTNYLCAIGIGVGCRAADLDDYWGFPMPTDANDSFNVTIGAGGAETMRMRGCLRGGGTI